MVKLLIEFVQYLNAASPLFLSLAIFTLLAILLAKSIKKRAIVYYIVMAIPMGLVCIPFIFHQFGIETFSINKVPFLGGIIIRDYIHMGTLGFSLLIIIMYIGALNPKNTYVKRLLGIRKELSIISGFPILTHSLIRVFNTFPNALKFFTDHEGYLETTKVTNELGAGITNFSFVLGILMVTLFIPLWVTSFDAVRKRMGAVKWKKLQRWSYALYAMLFIHAMCLQVGYMLNPRQRDTLRPAIETTVGDANNRGGNNNAEFQIQQRPGRPESSERSEMQTTERQNTSSETARPAGKTGRVQSKGFSDMEVSAKTKRYIHIASLLLIFGSYLYLRLRKARKDAAKRKEIKNQLRS